MSGHVVYRPERPSDHICTPPDGGSDTLPVGADRDYPAGTVWRCDCDRTWVSRGAVRRSLPNGHSVHSLEWKRESRRARRKRERQGATPEQVWPDDYPGIEIERANRMPLLVRGGRDGWPEASLSPFLLEPWQVEPLHDPDSGELLAYSCDPRLPCPATQPPQPAE
ncbi:MAG TPA: hypothetical protein VHX38_02070 [Pseudonocardiaceae bacterium]|jgi:hypothetical protein|nr:hypothetical protein [Pseudonocardiaceae bacterium]